MDKRSRMVLAGMVALVTTLAESPEGWMPKSMLYVAMGTDLGLSESAIRIAENAGYVTTSSITVTITNEGRQKAAEIERELARVGATA